MKKKKFWKIILVGFLAGIISGFFGAGGGLILVPFFSNVLNINEVPSRSTCIFCIFFLVCISSFFYFKSGYIDWNISIKCAIGGSIGALIGSKLLIKLDKKILNLMFVGFLIYTGIKMII